MTQPEKTKPIRRRDVSPAAAAAVSRALSDAGITRAVEFRRGVELEGFAAMPYGDHVRVEYVPGPFVLDPDNVTAMGLTACCQALAARGYSLKRVVAEIAGPGGWRDGEVLEVRR